MGKSFLEQNVVVSLSRFADRLAQSPRDGILRNLAETALREFYALFDRAKISRMNAFVAVSYLRGLMAFHEAGLIAKDAAEIYIDAVISSQHQIGVRETAYSYLGRLKPFRIMASCRTNSYLASLRAAPWNPYGYWPGSGADSKRGNDELVALAAGLGGVLESGIRSFQAEALSYLHSMLNLAHIGTFTVVFYYFARYGNALTLLERAYASFSERTTAYGEAVDARKEMLEAVAESFGADAVDLLIRVLLERPSQGRIPSGHVKAHAAKLLAEIYVKERDAALAKIA